MTTSEISGTESMPSGQTSPITVNVGNGRKDGNGNGRRYPPTANSNAVVAWLEFIIKLLIIPALIWAVNIERRLTRIESNRFTSNDGLAIWRELDQKVDRVDVPPVWFIEQVNDIKDRQDRLETLLQEHTNATRRMFENQ